MLVSTNTILFVYSDSGSAHFGDIDRERKRERERESRHKRPQTPQMGFQSVLIYLSPWGLLSVVICLFLGRHDLCPSCFRLCIPFMSDNPKLHQLSHPASRTVCGNENRERVLWCRWSWRVNSLLLCIYHLPVALCVFIAFRRWKWEISRRHDKLLVAALFDARVHKKKRKKKTFKNHISAAWSAVPLTPFHHFLFFPLCFCSFSFFSFPLLGSLLPS